MQSRPLSGHCGSNDSEGRYRNGISGSKRKAASCSELLRNGGGSEPRDKRSLAEFRCNAAPFAVVTVKPHLRTRPRDMRAASVQARALTNQNRAAELTERHIIEEVDHVATPGHTWTRRGARKTPCQQSPIIGALSHERPNVSFQHY